MMENSIFGFLIGWNVWNRVLLRLVHEQTYGSVMFPQEQLESDTLYKLFGHFFFSE